MGILAREDLVLNYQKSFRTKKDEFNKLLKIS